MLIKGSVWCIAEQAQQDLLLLQAEFGITKTAFHSKLKSEATWQHRGRKWPSPWLDFGKVTPGAIKKAEATLQKFQEFKHAGGSYSTCETKHPLHAAIVQWSTKFAYCVYGKPEEPCGIEFDDPFHLWLNLCKADLQVLKDIFLSHGRLKDLQLWLMTDEIKLPHLQVCSDDDYDDCWKHHWQFRKRERCIEDKPQLRNDPNGTEYLTIQKNMASAGALLLIGSETSQLCDCFNVVKRLAETGSVLAYCLKGTSTREADPTPEFEAAASAYLDVYLDVGPHLGEHVKTGSTYQTCPAHDVRRHAPGWVTWLWTQLGLRLGHQSCQGSESGNGKFAGKIKRESNMRLSAKTLSCNCAFQVQRNTQIQLLCYPETVFKRTIDPAKLHCKVCGQYGHRAHNKGECSEHAEYKGPPIVRLLDNASAEITDEDSASDGDWDESSDTDE